jgi:hypothetical protein
VLSNSCAIEESSVNVGHDHAGIFSLPLFLCLLYHRDDARRGANGALSAICVTGNAPR